jgi:prepilin-type processing-associated H-X9-DG protein
VVPFNGTGVGKRGLGGMVGFSYLPAIEIWTMREVKASRVRVPSDMIAITDSGPHSSVPGSIADCFVVMPVPLRKSYWTFGPPGRVHAGGANVLFCDGHVRWFPAEDLIVNDLQAIYSEYRLPNSERDTAVARMWNIDHEP